MTLIETERLTLRTWEQTDAEAYFRINQDPQVTEFLPGPLTMEQVHKIISAENEHQTRRGYCFFAVELKNSNEFMGFIGIKDTAFSAHFTPAVEIGWRLGSQYWNQGYATEGARAALDWGFREIGFGEVVSFTMPENRRSIRVMEKIGMKRDFDGDFAHPKLEPDHRLSKHVLYRIGKSE